MPIVESLFVSAGILAAPLSAPGAPGDTLAAPPLHAAVPAKPAPRDTIYDLGRFHGVQDARDVSTRGDFARGFGWGLVAGPVGAIVAVRRSSSASLPLPETRRSTFLELGPAYQQGYHEGFEIFYPPRRREATLAGSMVGSVGFLFILLQVVDLPSRTRLEGTLPDPDPGFILVSIPVGSPRGPL